MATDYLRLLRIPHWIKNLFVFVPILFAKHLFEMDYFTEVLLAFFAFSFASSLVYVFNDLIDADYDRQHPVKKNRPIASGKVSSNSAKVLVVILFVIVVALTTQLNWEFNLSLAAYLIINVLYTVKLKDIIILDLFCIASGFMLRVLAGAFVIDVYISKWLILTTMFLALYLAVMKRRSELTIQNNNDTRLVLKDYSERFIDQISAIASGGLIICYALYSVAERTVAEFGTDYFVLTTIFVVFGVFRYMYLVLNKSQGENPTEVMLSDTSMIVNILLYILVITVIIYFA